MILSLLAVTPDVFTGGTGWEINPEGARPRVPRINAAWLTVVLLAVDLIAATQHPLLHGDLAKAEPKTLRTGSCTSRPPHPRTTPALAADPTILALGPAAGFRVRPARGAGPDLVVLHAGGLDTDRLGTAHEISRFLQDSDGHPAPTLTA